MSTRFATALLALATLVLSPSTLALAHEGHEHTLMGTVTMAAADHVMLKTTDNKDVTVQVTKDTKILKGKTAMKIADVKVGTRVVVTAVEEKAKMNAKTIEIGVVAATK